ncbi:hypothetical protein BT96DRAFT_933133 [Gymnopus androsaceus JB14]|uniref:Uncharacterized protein n=1 Tax=Gymnopus androsaceus JB14 TaxID=1447944 RepID=A0A6A4IAL5_9AGAR|nr:hypothetical protein BT96DRAFT_933133 [Gymnopus androsaceus JB14]
MCGLSAPAHASHNSHSTRHSFTHRSNSTVSRLKARVLATGTVAKDCKGNCGCLRKLNALDLAYLESCIEQTPDLFLKELQEQLFEARGVEASQRCIHTSLKRCGFTRKEINWSLLTNEPITGIQQSGNTPGHQLEQELDDMITLYLMLPALSLDGILHLDVQDQPYTGASFNTFID